MGYSGNLPSWMQGITPQKNFEYVRQAMQNQGPYAELLRRRKQPGSVPPMPPTQPPTMPPTDPHGSVAGPGGFMDGEIYKQNGGGVTKAPPPMAPPPMQSYTPEEKAKINANAPPVSYKEGQWLLDSGGVSNNTGPASTNNTGGSNTTTPPSGNQTTTPPAGTQTTTPPAGPAPVAPTEVARPSWAGAGTGKIDLVNMMPGSGAYMMAAQYNKYLDDVAKYNTDKSAWDAAQAAQTGTGGAGGTGGPTAGGITIKRGSGVRTGRPGKSWAGDGGLMKVMQMPDITITEEQLAGLTPEGRKELEAAAAQGMDAVLKLQFKYWGDPVWSSLFQSMRRNQMGGATLSNKVKGRMGGGAGFTPGQTGIKWMDKRYNDNMARWAAEEEAANQPPQGGPGWGGPTDWGPQQDGGPGIFTSGTPPWVTQTPWVVNPDGTIGHANPNQTPPSGGIFAGGQQPPNPQQLAWQQMLAQLPYFQAFMNGQTPQG